MTKQEIAAVLYFFVPAYVANMSPVFVRKWFAPGKSWIGFDQLELLHWAYAFVALLHVPPLLPTLGCLPIVFVGSIATTAIGAWLGLKESWL